MEDQEREERERRWRGVQGVSLLDGGCSVRVCGRRSLLGEFGARVGAGVGGPVKIGRVGKGGGVRGRRHE